MKYLAKNLNAQLCVCIIFFLSIAGCSREPEKPKMPRQSSSDVADKTTLLATIADDEKPQSVTPSSGLGIHSPLSATFQVIFSERGGGVAYIAEKNGKVYVVHNGRAGKQYATVGTVALSSDGRRIAYGAIVDGKWRMVIDGREESVFDTVGTLLFSPDGKHVAYQALQGERWFMVVDNKPNSGSKTNYLKQEFNADSTLIAYVENADDKNKGRLIVSDLGFKTQTIMDGIGLPMIMNTEKTRIAAVSKGNGKQRVIVFGFSAPKAVERGPLYDIIHNLAFGPDGVSLAYDADRAGEHFLIFNEKEERIPKGTLIGPPVIRPDLKAVGAIIAKIDPATQHVAVESKDNASMHQSFINDARKGNEYLEAANLVYNIESVDKDKNGKPVAVNVSEYNYGACWVDQPNMVTDKYKKVNKRSGIPLSKVDGGFLRPQ